MCGTPRTKNKHTHTHTRTQIPKRLHVALIDYAHASSALCVHMFVHLCLAGVCSRNVDHIYELIVTNIIMRAERRVPIFAVN